MLVIGVTSKFYYPTYVNIFANGVGSSTFSNVTIEPFAWFMATIKQYICMNGYKFLTFSSLFFCVQWLCIVIMQIWIHLHNV